MTSFIAGCGSGRSTSFIPAVPAACSVTTIAFMMIFSSGHLSLRWKCSSVGKPVRHLMPGAMASFRKRGWNGALPVVDVTRLPGLHRRELLDALPLPQQVTHVHVEAIGAVVDLTAPDRHDPGSARS